MAETGIPQRLETPAGTITFNDWENGDTNGVIQVTRIHGLDGAEVRAPTDNRPTQDGGIVHNFYRAGRSFTLEGRIIPPKENQLTVRREIMDRLVGYTDSMLRANGRYVYEPSGAGERFVNCRLYGPVEIDDEEGMIKTFQMPFWSEDPTIYSYALVDQTHLDDDVTITVTNNGTTAVWPVVQVFGDFTDFVLTNETTGQTINWSTPSGPVEAPDYIEIIMQRGTMYLNGNDQNMLSGLDVASSDFFQLVPGSNSISFLATGDDANTGIRIYFNDGFI